MGVGFICPYCNQIFPEIFGTHKVHHISFEGANFSTPQETYLSVHFYKCPGCDRQTVFALGGGGIFEPVDVRIYPAVIASRFPDYVPDSIRQDYMEACAIKALSPKASATLARRCLQGILRDFWGAKGNSLANEIDSVKSQIQPGVWAAIDAVRRIGNIGAHMEKDVSLIVEIDQGEADLLLKLIEQLVKDWYVARHDQEQLYSDILAMDKLKQDQRKGL